MRISFHNARVQCRVGFVETSRQRGKNPGSSLREAVYRWSCQRKISFSWESEPDIFWRNSLVMKVPFYYFIANSVGHGVQCIRNFNGFEYKSWYSGTWRRVFWQRCKFQRNLIGNIYDYLGIISRSTEYVCRLRKCDTMTVGKGAVTCLRCNPCTFLKALTKYKKTWRQGSPSLLGTRTWLLTNEMGHITALSLQYAKFLHFQQFQTKHTTLTILLRKTVHLNLHHCVCLLNVDATNSRAGCGLAV